MSRYNKKTNKIRKKINKGRLINRDITKVGVFVLLIFAALIVSMCIYVGFKSSSVINSSYNRRSDQFLNTVTRGAILSDDGTVLAYTETDSEGNETRIYPFGNLFAHAVGFDINGGLGIESSYNYYLLTSHVNLFKKIANEFLGRKSQGDSVETTLKLELQQKAADLLGNNQGAVICMNPDTGEVYVMLSRPDFDPNTISVEWDDIINDSENSCLLNRNTQGLYTPGSTFKIFTLYEYYLENPDKYNKFTYNCEGLVKVGDTTLSCINETVHGNETLKSAFANSCNCAFGTIGLSLDIDRFTKTNNSLLFGQKLPIDISSYESSFTLSETDSDFDKMATTIGQGNNLCSPLHLALIINSIANDGICMKPYLVKNIINPAGDIQQQFRSEEYRTLFPSEDAAFLKEYLREVVVSGTSTILNINPAYTAYGKSGTAQTESEDYGEFDHSWFVGWAEHNEQKLSICVIIENMQASGLSATYITEEIFDYYFK